MTSKRTLRALIVVVALLGTCPSAWAQVAAPTAADTTVTIPAVATPAAAKPTAADVKVRFNRLVAKRNQLHEQLRKLDRQAAEAVKTGQDPVEIHSRQISTQDQMDLTVLHLESLAMRNDFVVPPLPSEKPAEKDAADEAALDRVAGEAFQRGRDRALAELKRQTVTMLRSIDYEPFLQTAERG